MYVTMTTCYLLFYNLHVKFWFFAHFNYLKSKFRKSESSKTSPGVQTITSESFNAIEYIVFEYPRDKQTNIHSYIYIESILYYR